MFWSNTSWLGILGMCVKFSQYSFVVVAITSWILINEGNVL